MELYNEYERYSRQIQLKDFGMEGQQKLGRARVLVVGAGGLGCPILLYLAAAGVGNLGIVDHDRVAIHNLHRQVLYRTPDIGKLKAEIAAEHLQQLNPGIRIHAYTDWLNSANAAAILSNYDLVIDGSDNFATRYMINDACVLLGKPLVYGAIAEFEAQVALFNAARENEISANYRDIFPEPPSPGEVLNCAEAGVLGILPGITGTIMANEAIKLLTGIGQPLINRLYTFNALTYQTLELEIRAGSSTRSLIPANLETFAQTDYEWLCSSKDALAELDHGAFGDLCEQPGTTIIDIREAGEMPIVDEFDCLHIPMKQLADQQELISGETVIVFCQTGKRSFQAAKLLSAIFKERKKIYSLKGGILSWKQSVAKQPA